MLLRQSAEVFSIDNVLYNSLTFSRQLISTPAVEEAENVIIMKSHAIPWPDQVNLLYENFSKGLKEDLDAEKKIILGQIKRNWSLVQLCLFI